MSSRLQLDGRHHQSVVAPSGKWLRRKGTHGKTVWSMPERLRGFTTRRYRNPLYLYFYLKECFLKMCLEPWFLVLLFTAGYTIVIHTTLFAIKGSNNKKTNKTKKKKRNKPLQDKWNTTRQHNSILGLIFSTQSTNDYRIRRACAEN